MQKNYSYSIVNLLLAIVFALFLFAFLYSKNIIFFCILLLLWGAITATSKLFKDRIPISHLAWWFAMYVTKPESEFNDIILSSFCLFLSIFLFFIVPSPKETSLEPLEFINHIGDSGMYLVSAIVIIVCIGVGFFTEINKNKKRK